MIEMIFHLPIIEEKYRLSDRLVPETYLVGVSLPFISTTLEENNRIVLFILL